MHTRKIFGALTAALLATTHAQADDSGSVSLVATYQF